MLSTTLSAIDLDLGQLPVCGSQPRAPPVWLMAQGPFILSWTATIHFYSSADPSHTRAIASEPSPTPHTKNASGPHGITAPWATIAYHML